MAEQGRQTLLAEGVDASDVSFVPSIDMRYLHQWYELNVELPETSIEVPDLAAAAEAFHALHERVFGYFSEETPIEVLNVRLTAIGRTPKDRVDLASTVDPDAEKTVTEREIWSLTRKQMVAVPVYQGATLGPGEEIAGPAVIELGTTTIVVHDEYDAVVDVNGSFVLYLREQAERILPRLAL